MSITRQKRRRTGASRCTVEFRCDRVDHDGTITSAYEMIVAATYTECERIAIAYGWKISKRAKVCPACARKSATIIQKYARVERPRLEPRPKPVLQLNATEFVCQKCKSRSWIEVNREQICALCTQWKPNEYVEPLPIPLTDIFEPTSAAPGSIDKISVLRERVELGLPLWHQDDRCDYVGLQGGFEPRVITRMVRGRNGR